MITPPLLNQADIFQGETVPFLAIFAGMETKNEFMIHKKEKHLHMLTICWNDKNGYCQFNI